MRFAPSLAALFAVSFLLLSVLPYFTSLQVSVSVDVPSHGQAPKRLAQPTYTSLARSLRSAPVAVKPSSDDASVMSIAEADSEQDADSEATESAKPDEETNDEEEQDTEAESQAELDEAEGGAEAELDSLPGPSSSRPRPRAKPKPSGHRRPNPPLVTRPSACGASGQRAKNAPAGSSNASPAELAKSHTRADDCWVLINGVLLDISNLDHPTINGRQIIADKKACGAEVASELKMKHSDITLERMQKFRILPQCNFEFQLDQRQNPASLYGQTFSVKKSQRDVQKAGLSNNIDRAIEGKSPQQLMALLKRLDAGEKVPM